MTQCNMLSTRDQKNTSTLTLIDGDGAVGDPASMCYNIICAMLDTHTLV